ncbi:MAG: hypothetical protein HGB12_16430 [Bacteroidetes bacterium]|nr:hypothetical protein [Bacteroidota bacterium]
MNIKFEIYFLLDDFKRLDDFALLMCQDCNYGNVNDWFGAFRGGLYGFYSRLDGVRTHYYNIHAWLPMQRSPYEVEYHLTSIFFNMDSAVECLVFSLNALGNAINSNLFRDISNEKELKQIKPNDMIGDTSNKNSRLPLIGYKDYFNNALTYWQENSKLLSVITDHHDVSKHRESIFIGGMTRQDVPKDFFESLGVTDKFTQAMFHPMAEIILQDDPKRHRLNESKHISKSNLLLENLACDFCNFINKTGEIIYKDATNNIKF